MRPSPRPPVRPAPAVIGSRGFRVRTGLVLRSHHLTAHRNRADCTGSAVRSGPTLRSAENRVRWQVPRQKGESMAPPASTTCAVVGGGPAGMVMGLLLARTGVEGTVFERRQDFSVTSAATTSWAGCQTSSIALRSPRRRRAWLVGAVTGSRPGCGTPPSVLAVPGPSRRRSGGDCCADTLRHRGPAEAAHRAVDHSDEGWLQRSEVGLHQHDVVVAPDRHVPVQVGYIRVAVGIG